MKHSYKLIPAIAAAAVIAACADLDTAPNGSTVTTAQKEQVIADDPDMASAGTATIPRMLKQVENVWSGWHSDFGLASMQIAHESRGYDLMAYNAGYNWYSSALMYTDYNDNNMSTCEAWNTMYNLIYTCNSVAATISIDTQDTQLMYFRAQCHAFRAYAYMNLIQLYQFTYVGNESKPGVPIYTEENSDEMAVQGGGPRGTVKEVYEQILFDLDKAIEFLTAAGEYSASGREQKQYVRLDVAYGLRARVNLVMNNWSAAASDAQSAINYTNATPYTYSQLSDITSSGFWDASDNCVMWSTLIGSDDRWWSSVIENWTSFFCSFSTRGYTTYGAWRYIGTKLYETISSTDVRKRWWADENGNMDWLPSVYENYIDTYLGDNKKEYINLKFDHYNTLASGSTDNGSDYFLMRVEEMYLILAEAQAMSGNTGSAVTTINNFVKAYRDPNYNCVASSAEDIQDEIWRQRRIELWGEGFAYFDIMRLKKDIDRRGCGFEAESCFYVPYGSDIMIYMIPLSEIQANPMIPSAEQNTKGVIPSPVADY